MATTGTVVRWAGGTLAITFSVLLLALDLGHGAGTAVPAGLPAPGPVTTWGLPVLRTVTDLAELVVVGMLLTGVLLLPSTQGQLRGLCLRAFRTAGRVALLLALLPLGTYVLTVSDIFAVPAGEAFSLPLLRSLLDVPLGPALLAQSGLAALVALSSRWALSVREGSVVLGLALTTLVPPALSGHTSASGGHTLASVSLLIHLVAVSLWVGGLLGLAWVAVVGSRRLSYGVVRFSGLAAWCLVTVGLSGLTNAVTRLGTVSALINTSYGVLVLVKASALVALGAIGWVHRRRTVPAFAERLAAASGTDVGRVARRTFARVAAVELSVMAATVAVAVALSRTPTPVLSDEAWNPVTALAGVAMPSSPSVWRLLLGGYPDGLGLALVAFGGALYAAGVLRLRRRGDQWPVARSLSWAVGLLVIGWATFGGVGLYSHFLFSAHMVSHMLLSMVAPIFLVLAAPLTLALRALPGPRVPGELSPRGLLVAVLHSRAARVLTHPVVAVALFTGSLYALYFSGLFETLMSHPFGHLAMELHFLAVGSLLFYVLVGVDPAPRRVPPLLRFGVLLVTVPFHAFFAIAIMSENTVLADGYWSALHRPFLPDLLSDQYVGGATTWALGELPLVIVLAALFVQWHRSDSREATRLGRAERQAATSGRPDGEWERYNAYLARLSAHDDAVAAGARRPGGAVAESSDRRHRPERTRQPPPNGLGAVRRGSQRKD